MDDEICATIRDTPLGGCIGATIVDITGDTEKNRVYFHLSNGKTFFCTIGQEESRMIGMLSDD
jgi:hypothetical protein